MSTNTSSVHEAPSTLGSSYATRRGELLEYFDQTAADAWKRLTSDDDVSGVRANVRAGRDRMRSLALSFVSGQLEGQRLLDAGCGPGQFALEAAKRGAEVTAVDLSPTLLSVARDREASAQMVDQQTSNERGILKIDFQSGDMLAKLNKEGDTDQYYDHVVALDSLIHYTLDDMVAALSQLAARARKTVTATFAPRTPLLAAKHIVGSIFPKSDRSPAIVPIPPKALMQRIGAFPGLQNWQISSTERIDTGFYVSQALFLERRGVN
ncbi:MAG: magnesium protoporphyrin IX methyltransferase [Pseudomonadota bacterium]